MAFKASFTLFILATVVLCSCSQKKDSVTTENLSQKQITEKLVEANIAAIKAENLQIDKLIVSQGWKMGETPTGLRFQIIEKGTGDNACLSELVRFEYDVKLLTGEEIYSSAKTGPKEFRIGSGGVESGLEEGILLLKLGDKARFIIPSYLAHGLSGDQDRIPPKATLIYTVKIIGLE
jgi:FKBP-type peptidyl-prolyl cis-trans isomerase